MKKGFTLIELMVTVLIVGILASVALPQYRKAIEKARLAEALNVTASLSRAADAYLLQNRREEGRYLLGEGKYLLDVDFSGSMNCEENSCRSQHFWYEVYCDGVNLSCDVWGRSNKKHYSLHLSRFGNNDWERQCYYVESDGENNRYTDGSKEICDSLQSQGWSSYRDEDDG